MTTDYRDTLAEHLAAIAVEFVGRVRDHDPEANRVWLLHRLPAEADRLALLFVLAAAVPDDRSWTQLTAWARQPRPANPVERIRRRKAAA